MRLVIHSRKMLFVLFLLLLIVPASAQDEPEPPPAEIPVFDLTGEEVEPGEPDGSEAAVPVFSIDPIDVPTGEIVRVIVGLDVENYQLESNLNFSFSVMAQRSAIQSAQDSIFETLSLSGGYVAEANRFRSIPFTVLEVDTVGMAALQNNPQVTSIQLDEREYVYATNADLTYAHIGADTAVGLGFDGTGQVVVVIDQGLDTTHPAFSNVNVVAEACFTTNMTVGSSTYEVTCPGGTTTAFGTGAALPTGVASPYFHSHGQHVTGTVAGDDGVVGGFRGIAPNADVIAINTSSENLTTSSLPTLFVTDTTAALEWVYDNRNTYNIVVVNMSLGGSKFSSETDCQQNDTARGQVIDNLTAEGIAVIASSGNNGYSDGIGRPACHANAISVGSTEVINTLTDLDPGQINCNTPSNNDDVSSFSNSVSFLDLLAPGQCVLSATFGSANTYESWQGTSMSAPHVAGAWAILAQAYPAANVADILNAFKTTGVTVNDSRNGLNFPRIQVDAALDMTAATPVIIGPEDNTNTLPRPTFEWQPSRYAKRYRLVVKEGTTTVIDSTINNCSQSPCSYTPGSDLTETSSYTWTVTPINPSSNNGFPSLERTFTVSSSPNVTPNEYATAFGSVVDVPANLGVLSNDSDPNNLSLTASLVTDVSNGQLTFNNDGSFTYQPNFPFSGDDTFTYKASNGTQEGGPATVTITVAAPTPVPADQIKLVSPTGVVTDSTGNPTYHWVEGQGVTTYELYLAPKDNIEQTLFYGQVNALEICQNSLCSVDLTKQSSYPDVTGLPWLVDGVYVLYMNPQPGNFSTWILTPNEFEIDSPPTGVITPTGVTNTLTGTRPTIQWELDMSAATSGWFQVYIHETDEIAAGNVMNPPIWTWYSREQLCNSFTGTICAFDMPVDLKASTHYQAFVQSWGPHGLSENNQGGWVGPIEFNVGGPLPGLVTAGMGQFSGPISSNPATNPPTYVWDDDPLTNAYSIWFGDPSTAESLAKATFIENLLKTSPDLTCDGTTCTYQLPSPIVEPGQYKMYIQAIGPYGHARGGIANLGWVEGQGANVSSP